MTPSSSLISVLIMDDAPGMKSQFSIVFNNAILADFYKMIFTTNGKDALRYISHNRVDIALLDLCCRDNGQYGLETAINIHSHYPQIRIAIMTVTDVNNLHMALLSILHGFPFFDKSLLFSAKSARPILDLIRLNKGVPLPPTILDLLANQYARSEKITNISTSAGISSRSLFSATQLQIGYWYRDFGDASLKEVADKFNKDPETLRQAAKRLRTKLRELGFDIPDDQSGREAVVDAMTKLGAFGSE